MCQVKYVEFKYKKVEGVTNALSSRMRQPMCIVQNQVSFHRLRSLQE
jgi:hypothetical protein